MPHGAVHGHYRHQKSKMHKKPEIKKALSFWEVTLFGVGLILGAGIFVLIGRGAALAGNSLWLSFVVGAIICAFTGLSYCELSSRFPKESAEYIYTKKAFGWKSFSFIIGWVLLFAGSVSATAVALGFGEYFARLFSLSFALTPVIAAVLIVLVSLINFRGIKESADLDSIFTIIEIGGLLLIIAIGFFHFGSVNYFETPGGLPAAENFAPIMAAAALIFFAFLGFDEMPKIIEEVKDGPKIMPRALIYALVISTALYILVSVSAVSIVPWDQLQEAPLSSVVGTVWGSNGILLMSVIALFATFNTVLAIVVGFSRLLYGMAKEHGLPSILARIHPGRRTPHYSIFTIMFLSLFFLLLGDISTVASVTDLGIFIVFFVINISLIALRYKDRISRTGPACRFRAPLNIGWFPLTALFGMVSIVSLMLHFEAIIYVYEIGIIAVGFVFYVLMKK